MKIWQKNNTVSKLKKTKYYLGDKYFWVIIKKGLPLSTFYML